MQNLTPYNSIRAVFCDGNGKTLWSRVVSCHLRRSPEQEGLLVLEQHPTNSLCLSVQGVQARTAWRSISELGGPGLQSWPQPRQMQERCAG